MPIKETQLYKKACLQTVQSTSIEYYGVDVSIPAMTIYSICISTTEICHYFEHTVFNLAPLHVVVRVLVGGDSSRAPIGYCPGTTFELSRPLAYPISFGSVPRVAMVGVPIQLHLWHSSATGRKCHLLPLVIHLSSNDISLS